jgi:hypothetical protein
MSTDRHRPSSSTGHNVSTHSDFVHPDDGVGADEYLQHDGDHHLGSSSSEEDRGHQGTKFKIFLFL